MSGVIGVLQSFWRAYGRPALLALLLHAMLLAALLNAKFPPMATLPASEPVVSYLYQPPPTELPHQPDAENITQPEATLPVPSNAAPSVTTAPQQAADEVAVATPSLPEAEPSLQVLPSSRLSLAQRALNRAATVSPEAIEQAAVSSYQQLLQVQQQPKITVEKRHQALSADPAGQVFAQLDNGLQLIRVKGGCRFADPAKEGFEALMASSAIVPCGDEDDSSALLQQALKKHIKR